MTKSTRKTKSPGKMSKSKDGRRSRVRIPTQKGKLFGYSLDMPVKERRSLLKRLMKRKLATFSDVIKRLNVLAIYNYRRHPETTKRVRRDMAWVEKNLYTFRKSPVVGMKNIPKAASLVKRKITPKTQMTEFKLPSPVAQKMLKIMSRPDIIKAMSTKKPKKKSPKKSKSPKKKSKKSKVKSPVPSSTWMGMIPMAGGKIQCKTFKW